MPTLNFKITLSKRATYTIITFGILIILAIGVYAVAGSTPNPGHSLSELYTCEDGKTIVSRNGMWNCEDVVWEFRHGGITYTDGYVGIGEGVGNYDEEIKLSVKGAIQLNVYTTLASAPPCNSLTRGTIVFAYDWDEPPYSKMFACLYNINDYEYMRI